MRRIKIGSRWVGEGEPTFIVAEISANHLQKKDYVLRLVSEAKAAGAHAVKFQTYTPDTITIDADTDYFRLKDTLWKGRRLYELYSEAYTPWEWFPDLRDRAKDEGLIFFSTPFDETAVDFLEGLKVPCYKIASFEINHIPLVRYIASKRKPIILSTGLASIEDIDLAVRTIKGQHNKEIIILKCTSAYPAPFSEMNLKTIQDIAERFNVISGLSDHSTGMTAPVAAVALGGRVIEKHFTLDRKLGGPDAGFSLEPREFRQMVQAVQEAEQAVGRVRYALGSETRKHRLLMRSIFVVRDVRKGEKFTRENIRVIRPGHGMHPMHYEQVLGKTAKKDVKRGIPLDKSMVG
jgi:pseudaminic acid synthase